jgi:quercetin dioxygenase-like cupin family protein
MIEQIFKLTLSDDKTVERVIQDENIHYAHIVLNKDEGTPEHFTNATAYMTVVRGRLSIKLGNQEVHEYDRGNILKIPFNTKMGLRNMYEETLELLVVKAPAPIE